MVFVKGNKPGPGRPKGLKNRVTLLKEERRAIFDAEVSQVFEEKIHAARPEYLLDQFLGKPVETHLNVNVEVETNPALKDLANGLLDRQRHQ
jgi:hypothetical protein